MTPTRVAGTYWRATHGSASWCAALVLVPSVAPVPGALRAWWLSAPRAARAVAAIPGDGRTAHACRLAIAQLLALDDGPERERWRGLLAESEAALLDGRGPPRPGLANVEVLRALRAAEREAGLMQTTSVDALKARENRKV